MVRESSLQMLDSKCILIKGRSDFVANSYDYDRSHNWDPTSQTEFTLPFPYLSASIILWAYGIRLLRSSNNAFLIAVYRDGCLSGDVMCSRSFYKWEQCRASSFKSSCFLVLHLGNVYVQHRSLLLSGDGTDPGSGVWIPLWLPIVKICALIEF